MSGEKRKLMDLNSVFDNIPESEAKRAKVCMNIQTKSTLLKLQIDEIDQHLACHFKYNGACLSSHSPFLCSQTITHYDLTNSII